ncbi:MAG: hypothetical protein HWE20_04655 [Gammaproteobacteria bacterium]|nr:hypothetical protein [Gammaproteobacteria bacterium]
MSIPVRLAETMPEYGAITPSTWYRWTQDQTSRFEINTITGTILTKPPVVTSREISWYAEPRSVLSDTAGHYIYRDQLISQPW